mgnify:CR=1 FL=1
MRILILTCLALLAFSCTEKIPVDLIIKNGTIYTMNDDAPIAELVAVKDGKIVFVGKAADAANYTGEVLDLQGKTLTPGWHEGHAHIMGIGYNQLNIDLMETQSYAEIIEMVKQRAANTPKGEWIVGRGWHQDKWTNQPERMFKNLPTHHDLSAAVPDHPVYLKHASGHMALANAKAMEMAGISGKTTQPNGGEIFMELGSPTGIFNETAQYLVNSIIPAQTKETDTQALNLAFEKCLRNGITTFHQAGSDATEVALFKDFGAAENLKLRLYVMLSGSDSALLKTYFEKGIEVGLFNNRLTIRSVKLYGDGALGSRGAWLLESYSDAPDTHGHEVTPFEEIDAITQEAYSAGFQVCVHAIGDRANREVLDLYERTFTKKLQADPRFRVEHAQHIDPADIPRFGAMGVIPAMQAIHMASDRPWAIDRLGKKRIEEGAYMWQQLLQTGARIVNGSDAPVEPINPIASFYASVARKTLNGTPENGYEPAQCMTREQALRSYTLDAAYGAFMETFSGSIEVGKVADFTVFDKDLLTIPEKEILSTTVQMTIIDGKVVYKK